MLKKVITIEGMHCSHCASTIENALSDLSGVTSAKVNLDKKTCTIKLSEPIEDSTFMSIVENAGFEVISIETKKSLF